MDLAPDLARVERLDSTIRVSLSSSLDYLLEFRSRNDGLRDRVLEAMGQTAEGPVSPFAFAHYAGAVREFSRGDYEAADVHLAFLVDAVIMPPPPVIVPFDDPSVSAATWLITQELLDTDVDRPLIVRGPSLEWAGELTEAINEARALLSRVDPVSASELDALVRVIILGAPVPRSGGARFDGASTFFLWGGTLLNAHVPHDLASTVDVLIHEASHLLLFALAGGAPLAVNDPGSRYPSPLRSDPRPMEGLVHGVFVCTRVHLILTRMLQSGLLDAPAVPAFEARLRANEESARQGLATMADEWRGTPIGEEVMASIPDYWLTVGAAS